MNVTHEKKINQKMQQSFFVFCCIIRTSMYGTSYVKKYLSNKVYIFKSANTYKTENNITSNITNHPHFLIFYKTN